MKQSAVHRAEATSGRLPVPGAGGTYHMVICAPGGPEQELPARGEAAFGR